MKLTIKNALPLGQYALNQQSSSSNIRTPHLSPSEMRDLDDRNRHLYGNTFRLTKKALQDGSIPDDEPLHNLHVIANFEGRAPYDTFETFLATKSLRKAFCKAAGIDLDSFHSDRITHREFQNNCDVTITNERP